MERSVPLETHRFLADVHAALEHQALDLAKRRRMVGLHRHCAADDLERTIDAAGRIFHETKLRTTLPLFKENCPVDANC